MATIIFVCGTPEDRIGFTVETIRGKLPGNPPSYIEGPYTKDLETTKDGKKFVIKKVNIEGINYLLFMNVHFINPNDVPRNRGAYIATGVLIPATAINLESLKKIWLILLDISKDLTKNLDKINRFPPGFKLSDYVYSFDKKPGFTTLREIEGLKSDFDKITSFLAKDLLLTINQPYIEFSGNDYSANKLHGELIEAKNNLQSIQKENSRLIIERESKSKIENQHSDEIRKKDEYISRITDELYKYQEKNKQHQQKRLNTNKAATNKLVTIVLALVLSVLLTLCIVFYIKYFPITEQTTNSNNEQDNAKTSKSNGS